MNRRTFMLLMGAASVASGQAKLDDPILEAMRDELDRSLRLRIAGETPYYIEYAVEQGSNLNCSASSLPVKIAW